MQDAVNNDTPKTRSGRPYSGEIKQKKRLIIPQFSASTLARAHIAQNLFKHRNALPLHTQTHIEKLCEIAASSIMSQARKIGSPPPTYSHTGNFHAYARDEFGLPVSVGDSKEPFWVIKRRNFLKKLSVQDRNLLLTGDPYFRFDPVVYDCCFFAKKGSATHITKQYGTHYSRYNCSISLRIRF